MSEKLYYDLLRLRNKLKESYNLEGRTPTICTDSALKEMARLEPKTKEELLNVAGLGSTFVEKYGDDFLQVIHNYHNYFLCSTKLSFNVRETLEELENRLVNINKKNRLLYMSRIYNRYSFDMFNEDNLEQNEKVLKLIQTHSGSLKICDKSVNSVDSTQGEKDYKKLLTLYREVMKDYRESGEFDLYLGYPFIIGKAVGEDFPIRAPLMLFPVEVIRKPERFEIKIDKTKDVLYNNTLILLHNKFNNINKKMPSNVVEVNENLIENCLKYFAENGIEIQNLNQSFSAFKEYNESTFPNFKKGEFYLDKNVVLGKFSFYSSSLQRDFRDILESENINGNINDLVKENDDENLYEQKQEKVYPFSESHINYINDLNTSQENAVLKVSYENRLVIQGPPGTGKSQTITSIIADYVCKGQNVLMVSQKKAAIDVIYSRLGNLSKYAMLVNDANNKEEFYKQISNMIYNTNSVVVDEHQFVGLSQNIDNNVEKLEEINQILFQTDFFGEKPYKIYQENLDNKFLSQNLPVIDYFNYIDKNILALNYNEVKTIYEKFLDKYLLENSLIFADITKKFDWLKDVKNNLTSLEQNQMKNLVEEFNKSQNEFLKFNFIKKLFKKKNQKLALKQILQTYFNNSKLFNLFFKTPNVLSEGINRYAEYISNQPFFESLSENEKLYINSLNNLKEVTNNNDVNKLLYNIIICNYIESFEAKNRLVLSNVNNFNSIVTRINNYIEDKKQVTKEKALNILKKAYNDFIASSKRYGEIKRIVDGKRKWSINKFLQKYGFELFKGIKIWMMTPETVSDLLPLENNLFDLLVFDEASQIYVEKAIPSIARSKKVVISGDHKQLRPSSLGFGRIDFNEEDAEGDFEEIAALDEESLLDLARFKFPETLLNFHYRAKYEELINFSNFAFYNARLNVSPNTVIPENPPIQVIKVDGLWEKRTNRKEAEKVVELIKDFLINRKNSETIGIITFNVSQRDLILDLLDEECLKDSNFSVLYNKELLRKDNGEDIGLFVKNIENVQGDERDYIIFSLAYAKNEQGKIVRNFGWLNQVGGENRLNVAISRAKQQIYIVTSIYPEELVTEDLQNEGPKLFRKYLDYAFAISNKNKALAQQILYSLIDSNKTTEDENYSEFTTSVYNALVKKGYNVERNIGLDNYKIDLAIKSFKNDKYLLAIECDSTAYTTSSFTRDRDLHRQKYLRSRGFKTYRLWTKNWLRNKNAELEKIETLLKRD